eukprot:Seg2498.5 transcript_id=Seg2498.5/GoldUCD/mRNA.D3Y31 product="hypothetical protein" protein_id=Seg2498.5/GoldUCD/D3Y31
MKTAWMVVSIFAVAMAKEFSMKVDESGETFQEEFKIDLAANTEKIIVPAHANRQRVEVLNDFDVGYSARKIVALQRCFIFVFDSTEQPPDRLERSLEMFNSTLGTGEYLLRRYKFIPLYEMTSEEVGQKIASHCAGLKMVLAKRFLRGDIDAEATKLFTGTEKRSRRANVRTFDFCNPSDAQNYYRCPKSSTTSQRDVRISCSFSQNPYHCVYAVSCTDMVTYFQCTQAHELDEYLCCSVTCRQPLSSKPIRG